MPDHALVTGSAGLIGSESVRFLAEKDFKITGIDNNLREYFFGAEASTDWNRRLLEKNYPYQYHHCGIDIRDAEALEAVFKKQKFSLIIHAAAQPSHDWAAREPLTDFSVNALGTLTLLENYRKYSPEATFIFMSTNKVYGDLPNSLPLQELKTRYELDAHHPYSERGIDETMSIDQSTHSLFGASKVSADILTQEYGRYFGLHTGVFRGGCLTGPAHSGAPLHGFLAYLAQCVATGRQYKIQGYKGKQVRDNIHAADLVNMFWHYHLNPRCGEVYNAGGARHSSVSVIEAIARFEKLFKKKAIVQYSDRNRVGDHLWYISDVSKFRSHYPSWDFSRNLDQIFEDFKSRWPSK